MTISVGAKKKSFGEIQHLFTIKNTQQTRNKRELPQLVKGYCL